MFQFHRPKLGEPRSCAPKPEGLPRPGGFRAARRRFVKPGSPALQLEQLEERLPTNALYAPRRRSPRNHWRPPEPPMMILYNRVADAGTPLAEVDFSSYDGAAYGANRRGRTGA